MKVIISTNKDVILISDEDYDLNQHTWTVIYGQNGNVRDVISNNHKPSRLRKIIGKRIGLIGRINCKDGNRLNFQRDNLREATHSQSGVVKKSISKHKGIYFNKTHNKYTGYVTKDYKRHYLHFHSSLEGAQKEREEKILTLFGEEWLEKDS